MPAHKKIRKPIDREREGEIMALAGWIGGKRTMAKEICAEFNEPGKAHRSFYDVCCGSCAILFAKEKCPLETVNDLHTDIINLAIVMQNEATAARLQQRIEKTLFCDELLQTSAGIIGGGRASVPSRLNSDHPEIGGRYLITDYHVERAYHYFVISWMGRGGEGGSVDDRVGFPIRWTSGGGAPGKRFRSASDSIPFWWTRLQNVLILCRDMFEVLDSIADEAGTVIYIDPPYLATDPAGKKLRIVKYRHEFETADHLRLALKMAKFRKARVIISYYFHPTLFDLFRGWTVRDMERAKNLSNARTREIQNSRAPEILLINGPSFASDAKLITLENMDGGQMSIIDEFPT